MWIYVRSGLKVTQTLFNSYVLLFGERYVNRTQLGLFDTCCLKGDSSWICALQMQNSDEALCCQLMHIAKDSLEIAKCSLKLLDLAR